jgi:asparagine synthase (glutamine-hydrolysing)
LENGINKNFPWNNNSNLRELVISPELDLNTNYEEYVAERLDSIKKHVPLLEDDDGENNLRTIHYLNIAYFMSNLLDRKDRMSMYTGLEVRVPFCDHTLVQYAYNIPWHMKYSNNQEKAILRKAFEGILPKNILYRKKNPYPKTYDPQFDQITRALLREIIADPNAKIHSIIDVKNVRKLLDDKSNPSLPWYGQLMDLTRMFAYLIQMEQWLNIYNIKIKI